MSIKNDKDFGVKFWHEMKDMADLKDFGKPEQTDRYKIDRASRQLCEIIKEIQNVLEGLK